RAWWMFRLFGHENVYVLDGGLLAWIEGGFKTISGPAEAPVHGVFEPSIRNDLIVGKEDILNNIDAHGFTMIDARPAGRFHGQMPEPRPGMRAGHIPGSVNIPFGALLGDTIRDLSFRPLNELE